MSIISRMATEQGTPGGQQEPATRGFLFADLRGYTDFVERHGDDAGARLLERYRLMMRGVISRQAGAEVRTEGDSFYVLFPSASRAVAAALEIVAAAGQETVEHPEIPIRVGVGVHAGETAETAEGPVGSAVNLAARICAQAQAGEVLVSDTVRGLTRTRQIGTFEPVGLRRLKGIGEPIALYRVLAPGTTAATPVASRRLPMPLMYVGVLVVVVVLLAGPAYALLAGFGASATPVPPAGSGASATPVGPGGPPTSSLATTASPSAPERLRQGALRAGVYATSTFQPGIVLTLEEGWSAGPEADDYLPLARTELPDDRLTFHRVVRASSDGCYTLSQPLDGPLALYDWLRNRPGLRLGVLSHPDFIGISKAGGSPPALVSGWQVDVVVESGVSCPGGAGSGIYTFPTSDTAITEIDPADQWLFLAAGQRARVIVATVAGANVTMVARTLSDSQLDPFLVEVEALRASLAFVSPDGSLEIDRVDYTFGERSDYRPFRRGRFDKNDENRVAEVDLHHEQVITAGREPRTAITREDVKASSRG
jgi:class 3 adenylate cyclase